MTYVGVVDSEFEEHGSRVLVNPTSSLELGNLVVDGSTVTSQLGDITTTTIDLQLAVDWIRVDVFTMTIRVFVRTSHLTRQQLMNTLFASKVVVYKSNI